MADNTESTAMVAIQGPAVIDRVAERILEQPIELIEGVEETLEELAQRHKLALFTKGHPDEQRMKVDRSGLGRHFSCTAIVKEKFGVAPIYPQARAGADDTRINFFLAPMPGQGKVLIELYQLPDNRG